MAQANVCRLSRNQTDFTKNSHRWPHENAMNYVLITLDSLRGLELCAFVQTVLHVREAFPFPLDCTGILMALTKRAVYSIIRQANSLFFSVCCRMTSLHRAIRVSRGVMARFFIQVGLTNNSAKTDSGLLYRGFVTSLLNMVP